MDNDTNNDYKKLWEILQRELRDIGDRAKQDAINTFESDNRNNYDAPKETSWFAEQMARVHTSQEILNLMTRIEIQELLFFKHEEKCRAHYESKKEID